MFEELMPFDLPNVNPPIIKVFGVGGGGSNAVNYMFKQGIKDVDFVVCNTDSQALTNSPVPNKIQLGKSLTEGRGAGNKPDRGREAALESIDEVVDIMSNDTKMVFITAGMGGGTGTGAAPVIAKASKDLGILTVAIVTIPFRFEGQRRISQAISGINELCKHVDSLLVINNEKLREIFGDLKISDAFSRADDVLNVAARGIAEIITIHGHVNVDFADVQTVMANSGVALLGQGTSSGEDRAIKAIQQALNSPLLNSNDIHGAKNILLNINSGNLEVTMDEIGQINDYVQEAAGYTADLIWGNSRDESLGEKISVTIIATGFKTDVFPELKSQEKKKTVVTLEEEPVKKTVSKEELFVLDTKDNASDFLYNSDYNTPKPREYKTQKESSIFTILDDNANDHFELTNGAKKATDRVSKLRNSQDRSQSYFRSDEIEGIENEPAYTRNGIQPNMNYSHMSNTNLSRYTLVDDDDKRTRLRDNPYLNDKVD